MQVNEHRESNTTRRSSPKDKGFTRNLMQGKERSTQLNSCHQQSRYSPTVINSANEFALNFF